MSAPEFLTQELEKKQMKEREMFYLFLLAANMDETMKKEVTNLESEVSSFTCDLYILDIMNTHACA